MEHWIHRMGVHTDTQGVMVSFTNTYDGHTFSDDEHAHIMGVLKWVIMTRIAVLSVGIQSQAQQHGINVDVDSNNGAAESHLRTVPRIVLRRLQLRVQWYNPVWLLVRDIEAITNDMFHTSSLFSVESTLKLIHTLARSGSRPN